MLLTQITAPTVEPVTSALVKMHTRIDQAAEDSLLDVYIASARALAEAETERQIVAAEWTAVLDGFPCGSEIVIPKAPLRRVVSVKYLDGNGTEQTWASTNYVVETPAGETAPPGVLRLAYGVSWPTVQDVARSVRIRFVAGYTTALDTVPATDDTTDIPAGIRHAIYVGVAESYKQREETIQGTISSDAAMTMRRLLAPFCVRGVWL